MTRNGKIARLPKAIRDHINRNLEDGVPGIYDLRSWRTAAMARRRAMAGGSGRLVAGQSVRLRVATARRGVDSVHLPMASSDASKSQ